MNRLGYTYPEATMSLGLVRNQITQSLGLPRVERSGAVGSLDGGLDLRGLGVITNQITMSLGQDDEEATPGQIIASVIATGVVTGAIHAIALSSYKAHGSPVRAGVVTGSIFAGTLLALVMFSRLAK